MKPVRSVLLLSALLGATIMVVAQTQLTAWPFFVEISATGNAGVHKFTVPLHVLGQARDDLGDLRLFDSENHEIPYAILTRKEVNDQRQFDVHVFNKVTTGNSTEATMDLGENPVEHNEVQIETAGSDFRRRVSVDGSDTSSDWRTLRTDGVIFGFESDGKTVDSKRVSYPSSRFRYLRVRVSADEMTDHHAPEVTDIKVLMSVHEDGQLTTWGVMVPEYQLLRNQGAYASAWVIDLGALVPCDRLSLNITEQSFYRPFQLEAVDDPQNPRLVATGNLSRRVGEENKVQVIKFDQETHVRKLRLQVTDYSNQTLSIESIQASAPARELVFELKQVQPTALRLYFGNSKIDAPHYDFEKELGRALKTPAAPSSVSDLRKNPIYTPEPLPFTERVPWLIYLVLIVSSVVLGWILFSLARKTMRSEPAPERKA